MKIRLSAALTIISIAQANILDVNLTADGFNYAVPINISLFGMIDAIVTTANNNELFLYNRSYVELVFLKYILNYSYESLF